MLGSPFPAPKEPTTISFRNLCQLLTASNVMLAHPALTRVWLTKTQVLLVHQGTTALPEPSTRPNSHATQVTLPASLRTSPKPHALQLLIYALQASTARLAPTHSATLLLFVPLAITARQVPHQQPQLAKSALLAIIQTFQGLKHKVNAKSVQLATSVLLAQRPTPQRFAPLVIIVSKVSS